MTRIALIALLAGIVAGSAMGVVGLVVMRSLVLA